MQGLHAADHPQHDDLPRPDPGFPISEQTRDKAAQVKKYIEGNMTITRKIHQALRKRKEEERVLGPNHEQNGRVRNGKKCTTENRTRLSTERS